ncbi:hypothetical protein KI387_004711, partial [Taxus chinensis]
MARMERQKGERCEKIEFSKEKAVVVFKGEAEEISSKNRVFTGSLWEVEEERVFEGMEAEVSTLVNKLIPGVVIKAMASLFGASVLENMVTEVILESAPSKLFPFDLEEVPSIPNSEAIAGLKEVKEIKFGGIDFKISVEIFQMSLPIIPEEDFKDVWFKKAIFFKFLGACFSRRKILYWVFWFWGKEVNPK